MIVHDLAGQRFGKLTVIERDLKEQTTRGANCSFWRCRCDCGRTCTVRRPDLVSGKRTDCGCVIKSGSARPKDAEPIFRVTRRVDERWEPVALAQTKKAALQLRRTMSDQRSLRIEKMNEFHVWEPIASDQGSKARYDAAEREHLAACRRSDLLRIADPWAEGRMPGGPNYCPVV